MKKSLLLFTSLCPVLKLYHGQSSLLPFVPFCSVYVLMSNTSQSLQCRVRAYNAGLSVKCWTF